MRPDYPLPDQSSELSGLPTPHTTTPFPMQTLSDFFLVWLKRTLPNNPLWNNPFETDNPLSPKIPEAVHDETKSSGGRPKDRKFFEETMERAFKEGRRVLRDDGIGAVVFAHKTTEGWEALLSGMIRRRVDYHGVLAHRHRDGVPAESQGLRSPCNEHST